eukprot:TRINITY_DN13309_c0_g1_i1.p1 TRINITY_DN13309_c0_g1~~TRINITY_DN13309_c0_g1_i1.p1  ORF type:complete len:982 (-),score=224.75 TRINITY_DN13309_c0_g1_i1:486-3431(-)
MTHAAPVLPLQLRHCSCASPLLPLFPKTKKNRQRSKIRVQVSIPSAEVTQVATFSTHSINPSIFGGERQLRGAERFLEGFSAPARHGTCLALVAAALAAGYAGGSLVRGTRAASIAGAVALGLASSAAAFVVNSAASRVAAVKLHNKVVSSANASLLTRDDVESIVHRYVSSVLPSPNKDLNGDEADAIVYFKNVLGIDDPDAAAVHMEIGRRIFRQRLESGNRNAATEELRAFQKFIYVSNLVFGDASTFLLPWKRVFKVTESQVEVAICDNAKRLFLSKLNAVAGDVDEKKFIALREAQLKLRLPDEVAADCFRAHTRRHIENFITSALAILNFRGRLRGPVAKVKEELDKILSYNNALISVSKCVNHEKLPQGFGAVAVAGGEYATEQRKDALIQLYKAYLTEVVSSGRLEDEHLEALNQLRDIFGLAREETDKSILEITAKWYRRRLAQSIKGGDLEAASSKAAFLQNLCDELHFDPNKASQIHQELYKQKLQQCVLDGELSKQDVATLLNLRVMFCIPQDRVDAIHLEVCGSLFVKVIDEVLARGVDGYDFEMELKLSRTVKGLRLPMNTLMGITYKQVHEVLLSYARRALEAVNVDESVKELNDMVVFHNFVSSRLLTVIKGVPTSAAPEILLEESKQNVSSKGLHQMLQSNETVDLPQSKQWLNDQSEITLEGSLPLSERMDLYKNYLMFSVSVELTSKEGSQLKGQDKKYSHLPQLGRILALTTKHIAEVNYSLLEKAFTKRAGAVLQDKQLTRKKLEDVLALQKEMGLPSERAQKVVKNIIGTKFTGPLMQAVEEGQFTVADIKDLQEVDMDINVVVPKDVRQVLFKKILDRLFSSGTGEFDEEEVYERVPAELGIETAEAKVIVQEFAREKVSSSLIHLVSLLRQRKTHALVSSLNNLLACDKVAETEPLSWTVKEELADIFSVYLESNPSEDRVQHLQYLLNIDESLASSLKDAVVGGESISETGQESAI